jgi:D-sedoheptulose 7-phosphate isomerase
MTSDEISRILRLSVIRKYFDDIKYAMDNMPLNPILEVIDVLQKARIERKTVYIFGNGGSAATASHCACDFSKGANHKDMPGLKVVALNDNVPLMTAWANDESYSQLYARQIENVVEKGDVAIGISVSGNSPNVLNCIKAARDNGALTIGFTSKDGGELKNIVDIPLRLPVDNMEQAEDLHLLLGHVITTCLRLVSSEMPIAFSEEGEL